MKQFTVKVIPGAKRALVKEEAEGLKVYLTAPALEGKANKSLIEILAHHFKVKKGQVIIKSGLKSRNKEVQISE